MDLFKRLASKGNTPPVKDLLACLNPAYHPSVAARLISSSEAVKQFINHFHQGEDGKGTWKEFLDYLKGISVAVEDDDAFGLLIREMFDTGVPSSTFSAIDNPFAKTTRRRFLAMRNNGTSEIVEVLDDTANGKLDTKQILQNLRDQGMRDVVSIRL